MENINEELQPAQDPPPVDDPLRGSVFALIPDAPPATPAEESSLFVDHYSLQTLSDTIRFRGANIHVYERNDRQLLLEENFSKKNDEETADDENGHGARQRGSITVKLMENGSSGVTLLRAFYALIAFLMSGFIFVFFCQVILTIFLNMVIHSGSTSLEDYQPVNLIGAFLSVPYFVNGMSSAMSIAGTFTADLWNGQQFTTTVAFWAGKLEEWLTFMMLLGIPVLVMIGTLFARSDVWWTQTGLTWFICVLVYFLIFALIVIFFEVKACFDLVRLDPDNRDKKIWSLVKEIILLRQMQRYSGEKHVTYLVDNTKHPDRGSSQRDTSESQFQRQESIGLYSRLTNFSCCDFLFRKLETPTRIYRVEDLKGTKPFLTNHNWDLTKSFFKYKNANSIMVVKGPAAVNSWQIRSSFACSIIGTIFALFWVIGLLVWFDFPWPALLLVIILLALCVIPRVRGIVYRHRLVEILRNDEDDKGSPSVSEIVYRTHEYYRITKATDTLCWIMFALEFFILFVWPIATLFGTGDNGIAGFFILISVVSNVRHYFNPKVIIRELGSLDRIVKNAKSKDNSDSTVEKQLTFEQKSRIAVITEKISNSRLRSWWMYLFLFLALMVFVLFLIATYQADSGLVGSDQKYMHFLPDFYYDAQPTVAYPTCQVKKGLGIPDSLAIALPDLVALSAFAYYNNELVQEGLDSWFGEGVAKDRADIVARFKQNFPNSAVGYNFITFEKYGVNAGIVAVRGTENAWDALADLQLWSSAALAKGLRAVVPAGGIWTPILPYLISGASVFGRTVLDKIAFYKETTQFVEFIQELDNFGSLWITGHSLGGGIAIITGSQTGIPAFGVSGVPSMLSRRTFSPPITSYELNHHTFNIVPDRDIIPRVDDQAENFQKIFCHAPKSSIFGCHEVTRTLCELLYECGTGRAPALCECSMFYEYPQPLAMNGTNRTFEEACANVSDS